MKMFCAPVCRACEAWKEIEQMHPGTYWVVGTYGWNEGELRELVSRVNNNQDLSLTSMEPYSAMIYREIRPEESYGYSPSLRMTYRPYSERVEHILSSEDTTTPRSLPEKLKPSRESLRNRAFRTMYMRKRKANNENHP